ncbi:MAG: hypothetical protein CVU84_17525 [Firmicutes bacterium HGW-Firmicutes-1]|jgi:hypothetical protein|nr:MAG: hypothetical protein CVU84_17525 [Firmicutes bacterium HGW-Firmicutes-1]
MRTIEVIALVILFIISLGSFVVGYFQFKEKGILFNNAYLYASKEERNKMNKKPHYRQSAIVFVVIGIIFLLNAIEMIIRSGWIFHVMIGLMILLIIYAIISSIIIERKY